MTVSWTAPIVPKPNEIDRYIIHYHPVDDENDNTERVVDGNVHRVILRRTWTIFSRFGCVVLTLSGITNYALCLCCVSVDLIPNTEYMVSVFCVYEERQSSPVISTQRTSELTPLSFIKYQ